MTAEPVLTELAAIVGRVRGQLLSAETAERAVQLLAEALQEVVPAATGAGVTLIRDGRPTSTGSTSEVVARADALQYETGQGPCLTAWAAGTVIQVEDARTDARWPAWGTAAAAVPVLSCVSVPLHRGREPIGALKVYSPRPGAFTERTGELLLRFAAAVATLLGHIQTTETPRRISAQLAEVLRTRDVTQLAKGILMGRHAMSETQAQLWLLHTAQAQGRSVAVVAEALLTAQGPA